ncbi:TIGR01777 family oxidoreductase [Segetibacter koreensis]|uniref:TIGR01777 family oxidoreductase n=1 Tax=Segetibacter koreensis TaxID=398037 RepID=UPI00037A94C6|nr:TIGR01777 family oxidoreductase [Segetibacter koreensis]
MSTILITGGTGLIGSALTDMLTAKGHKVIILTRTEKTSKSNNITFATWDVKSQKIDESAISSADYIVHLAGAGVADKRWTSDRKKEIVESRTQSGALLVKALQQVPNKVKAVICASAIGWYGKDENRSPKKKAFTEDMRADKEFLGETCRLWEESVEPIKEVGKRLVKLRIGIVLSNEGGALPEFKKPVKFGIAGVLGSGKQVVSWIHIEDLCRTFIYAIENENLEGVYNAVAPTPVTNKELTLLLAQKMKGRFFVHLHVPVFVLKVLLGELSVEVLKSATVSSEKIRSAGFTFLYPSIESALDNLIR